MTNARPLQPSRRGLMIAMAGGAAASGIAIPALAAEPHPDAAILATEASTLALITEAKRLDAELAAAEELVEEMTRPVPQPPRDVQLFATDAAYAKAVQDHAEHSVVYWTRVAQIEARVGVEGLLDACHAADQTAIAACRELEGMRATTLDGLAVKARIGTRWAGTKLHASIVADLLAMGAAA
jgi:hypothetical protein